MYRGSTPGTAAQVAAGARRDRRLRALSPPAGRTEAVAIAAERGLLPG